jgi:hypothetical protein
MGMPHVPAVGELGDVFPKVLAGNVGMGSRDSGLQQLQ